MALSPERAPSSLTSIGTLDRRCKYKVFLSFRGADTRKGFVSHLFNELERQGISTFMDDRELEGGLTISTELLSAIGDSYLSIIVLSQNYASSSWCLGELTNIVQCMDPKDSILPIFYEVDPSAVRKQLGSFAKAFKEHDKKFTNTEGREKVKQWKADLTKVANLKGWHSENYMSERELIEDIVKCVRRKVQTTFQLLDSPDKFVERDSALNRLIELLDLGANDVRFIGITGMGGIGKTTLGHRVCDIISRHFAANCFLENVREASAKDLTLLQNQLLFSIFKEKDVVFWDARRRVISTREGLRNKKVLLVLDDVDHLDQLQKLAGEKDWFGNGSRIIITTRNRHLLVQHDITFRYEVEGMSAGEALALFSLKAFKKLQPDEEFLELSEHFVNHAKGVPLVLKVWGSLVYKRDRDTWNSVLNNLQNYRHRDVFDSLKISYDGLQEEEKIIFLDIACFHKGKAKEQVIDILNRRFDNISSLIVIDTLIERSLLLTRSTSRHFYLDMHDLIQEMGWEIVDRESKEEPGNRTRIWRLDDLRFVLAANTGTGKVEAIVVKSAIVVEEILWDSNGFSNMRGLRHLELDKVNIISPAPIRLPHFLRIIRWSRYPYEFLPQNFHALYLTELTMYRSNLVRLWDGRKNFPTLKIMNLFGSDKLTTTPDFTGVPNLEVLRLSGCQNLVEIHPSIAVLKRLKVLNFTDCVSIKSLPSKLELDSLEVLNLRNCSKLEKAPEFSEKMKTLSCLFLDRILIEQLPSSVGNHIGLTVLTMAGTEVVQLWNGRKEFPNLTHMILDSCDRLTSLVDFTGIPNLEWLSCPNCTNLGHIDPSILVLKSLDHLNLSDCNLGEGDIPKDIGCLSSLRSLNLGGNHFSTLPASIQRLSKLQDLKLQRCERLQELPPLPPSRGSLFSSYHDPLRVHLKNCTSLHRLIDPPKLSSKFANLYDSNLYALNCVRLVEDKDWINYVLSRIVRWINTPEDSSGFVYSGTRFIYPGSEIPEWFIKKSEQAEDWLGIAFCVVFAGDCPDHFTFRFKSSSRIWTVHKMSLEGHLGSEHLTIFYRSRDKYPEECPEDAEAEFSFETAYRDEASDILKVGVNMVKKWAARWVYKQDLEDLQQRLEIPKRTLENYGEEAGPSGSDAISVKEEPNRKGLKIPNRTFENYGEEAGPSGSDAISVDEEPNLKGLKIPKRTLENYGEEAGPSGSDAISVKEEPNRKGLKIPNRTFENYGEEAGPSGSDAISVDEEPNLKGLKITKRTFENYGEEAGPSGSDAISDDEEPNRKGLKIPKRTLEYYGEEASPSERNAISDDEEPNRKRQEEERVTMILNQNRI